MDMQYVTTTAPFCYICLKFSDYGTTIVLKTLTARDLNSAYMKLSKIYDPREMNSYQFVAATGFVMTLVANIILLLIGKSIENFMALYACWSVFFILGAIANFNSKPGDNEHHHHHH